MFYISLLFSLAVLLVALIAILKVSSHADEAIEKAMGQQRRAENNKTPKETTKNPH